MYKTIGWTLTVLWLVTIVAYIWSGWSTFISLGFNEKGDFVAGAFAPLAFLWLIIGYFQQGEELKQNTLALELQAKELRNSVEQQSKIAKSTEDQVRHLIEQSESNQQPHFLNLGANLKKHSEHDWTYILEFRNIGKLAIDVRVQVTPAVFEVSPNFLDEFRPDTWYTIKLNVDPAKIDSHIQCLMLTFIYADINGRFKSAEFIAEFDSDLKLNKFRLHR